jgi:hypothetical protein
MPSQNLPHAPHRPGIADERGTALIIALMVMLLLMALGIGLTLVTTTETRIAGNHRAGSEALYAADAAIERVMQDLLTVPDWNRILDGTLTSSFMDGPPGIRNTTAGTINLVEATNMVRCGKITPCSDVDMDEVTDERPWGANNPRWQLYAYGPVVDMLPTETLNSDMYVIVWVADDPADCDNNPLADGGPQAGNCTANIGAGVISMLAYAYGAGGVRRVIETTVARTDSTEIERGYTGQRGQDEQNRRARKAAVQTPGKALSRQEMGVSSGSLQ